MTTTADPLADSPFTTATEAAVDTREVGVKRDGYGRYLIPPIPADTMNDQVAAKGYAEPAGYDVAWTRATTFAKSISDTFTLSQWSQRMTAKGLATRPDLVALAASTPVDDKSTLDDIVNQAKDAAASRARANLGTALHTFTEQVDRGENPVVPAPWDVDVAAYSKLITDHGITVDPFYIEKRVVIPAFMVAGTFDRIVMWEGRPTVLDLKTGRDLQYGWNEIAIQLCLYANAGAIWADGRFYPMPEGIRRDKALVIHLPVGEGRATLYEVNLEPAIEACKLCHNVRRWRKVRNIAKPLAVVDRPEPPVTVFSLPAQVDGKVSGTLAGSAPSTVVAIDPAPSADTRAVVARSKIVDGKVSVTVEEFIERVARQIESDEDVTRAEAVKLARDQAATFLDPNVIVRSEIVDGTVYYVQANGASVPLPVTVEEFMAAGGRPEKPIKDAGVEFTNGNGVPVTALPDEAFETVSQLGDAAAAQMIDQAARVPREPVMHPAVRVTPELAPIAAPGQRGCSVCRRTGHKKGSAKCLGDKDPQFEAGTGDDDRPPGAEPAAQTYGEAAAVPAKACPHIKGYARNPETGNWGCASCGEPSPHNDQAKAMRDVQGINPQRSEPAPLQETATPVAPIADNSPNSDTGELPDPFAAAQPVPAPVVSRPPTWQERIGAASSKGELAALFDEGNRAGQWTDELTRLGQARLAKLSEPGG